MPQYFSITCEPTQISHSKLIYSAFLKHFDWGLDIESGRIHIRSELCVDFEDIQTEALELQKELEVQNVVVERSTEKESEDIIRLCELQPAQNHSNTSTQDAAMQPAPCMLFSHHKLYPEAFLNKSFWFELLVPGSYILERAVLPILSEKGTIRMTAPYLPLHTSVLDYIKRRSELGHTTKILVGEQEKDHRLKVQKLQYQVGTHADIRVLQNQGKNILHAKLLILDKDNTSRICLSTSYNFTHTHHYEQATLFEDFSFKLGDTERFDDIWGHSLTLDPVAKRERASFLPNDPLVTKYYGNYDQMIAQAKEEKEIDESSIDINHLRSRCESEGTINFYGKQARICNAVILNYVMNKLDVDALSPDVIHLLERLKYMPFEDESDRDRVYGNLQEKKQAHRRMVEYMREYSMTCLLESSNFEIGNTPKCKKMKNDQEAKLD